MNDGKMYPVYLMNRPLEKPDSLSLGDLMRRYYQALRKYGALEKEAGELTSGMLNNVIADLNTGGAFDKLLEGESGNE